MPQPFKLDAVTEAAWYVLAPFIHPLDCSVRRPTTSRNTACAVFPMNKNEDLERFINAEPSGSAAPSPSYFSRFRLQLHLSGVETYYYRSRPNGSPRIGYGSSDAAKDRLLFDPKLLGIQGKAKRFPDILIILLGVDIDAHRGERDVAKVRDLILERYFPGAYSEPSTSGSGIHVYAKLAVPIRFAGGLNQTLRCVHSTVEALSAIMEQDRINHGLDAPIDHIRGLPTLLTFQNHRARITKRSMCIKIPRFQRGMQDIFSFHVSPFFLFQSVHQRVTDDLRRQLANLQVSNDSEPEDDFPQPDWDDFLEQRDRIGVVLRNTESVYPRYTRMEDLKRENDALRRGNQFYMAYSRQLGRVPTVPEALAEYERLGLNTGTDQGNRQARFELIREYVASTFDPRKAFNYEGYDQEADSIKNRLSGRLDGAVTLSYPKTSTRMSRVTLDDLCTAYWAMRKSQGTAGETQFSRLELNRAFQQIHGTACRGNKASCILTALQTMGLIRKVRNYVVGHRGCVWAVQP